jgi:hypothetical protein
MANIWWRNLSNAANVATQNLFLPEPLNLHQIYALGENHDRARERESARTKREENLSALIICTPGGPFTKMVL